MEPFSDDKFLEACHEISKTCDCHGKHCFFRDFVLSRHQDPRMLIQLQCILKFKYEESYSQHHDIGKETAMELWVLRGMAQAFAKVYSEEKSIEQIYKETIAMAPQFEIG